MPIKDVFVYEVLGASIVAAFVDPFLCMDTKMLCQSSSPGVGFPTAIEGAAKTLRVGKSVRV